MLNKLLDLFRKSTDEDKLLDKIIREHCYRPFYFSNEENLRVLGKLEEHTTDNGTNFFKLDGELKVFNVRDSQRLHIAMNRAFWSIDMMMEQTV